jgi:hypothetical protein
MKTTRERLAKKGWSEEEIEKTMKILESAEQKKHHHIKLLDKAVYWIAVLLIVFGNFSFSIFIMPLLASIKGPFLYMIVILLAGTFGIIISIIIRDLENLERQHHFMLLLIVPLAGLINFALVISFVNHDKLTNLLSIHQSPLLIGLVYFASFLVPYVYFVFEERWQNKQKT